MKTTNNTPVWAIFVTVPGHGTDGQDDQTFEVAHGWATKEEAETALKAAKFWLGNKPADCSAVGIVDSCMKRAFDDAEFDADELADWIDFPMHVGNI